MLCALRLRVLSCQPIIRSNPGATHMVSSTLSSMPLLRTTVVGSYPAPDWLIALPSQQALIDATRVVFKTQELAGVDVVADGELYRFDVNHPETNGMIEY